MLIPQIKAKLERAICTLTHHTSVQFLTLFTLPKGSEPLTTGLPGICYSRWASLKSKFLKPCNASQLLFYVWLYYLVRSILSNFIWFVPYSEMFVLVDCCFGRQKFRWVFNRKKLIDCNGHYGSLKEVDPSDGYNLTYFILKPNPTRSHVSHASRRRPELNLVWGYCCLWPRSTSCRVCPS